MGGRLRGCLRSRLVSSSVTVTQDRARDKKLGAGMIEERVVVVVFVVVMVVMVEPWLQETNLREITCCTEA